MKRILAAIIALMLSVAVSAQIDIVTVPKFVEAVDLTVLSCEGDQQTGQVVLTLSATPRNYMLSINIAGGWEGNAYGPDGRVYKMRRFKPGGSLAVSNVPHGVPCIFKYAMEGVPAVLHAFASITLPYHVSGGNYDFLVHSGNNGPMQLRNVPIAWKPRVSKTYIRLPFEVQDDFVVTPVSCFGDKSTGLVTMEITVLSRMGGESKLDLGATSYNNKAYDRQGNVYEISRAKAAAKTAPSNTPLKYTFTCQFTPGEPTINVMVFEFSFSNNQNDFSCHNGKADIGNIEIHNMPIEWQ